MPFDQTDFNALTRKAAELTLRKPLTSPGYYDYAWVRSTSFQRLPRRCWAGSKLLLGSCARFTISLKRTKTTTRIRDWTAQNRDTHEGGVLAVLAARRTWKKDAPAFGVS